ncbi:DUF3775 domain-containing protein [Gemmobacter fulvus]|uniref:DUF3775 domain-containing protein n=1 Tax=Gemmobacter fulvus TaxID=2840474 RepID=A0A975S0K9_9RHOB|nr:DUF3775 domain-containing protein [Gemmobacter fulvus]MBT9246916.1 DUF3775 domain-containing protein [Gemmobacter fulvus]MDQ1847335.1 DUF3775 domain-containing protein [Gemmobacter fulvus]QWK89692.1 DUF3775 domain-containing protein [Gemmobacter fulvus]
MLEISPAKVAHIIYQSREGRMGEGELHAFIAGLNEDEQAHLVALAWVGRGVYEADDFQEAVNTAFTERSAPTDRYLMGMPHLAENLEAGLEAMGLDVTEVENDFLRDH